MLYKSRATSTNNNVYLISLSLSDLQLVISKPFILTLHRLGIQVVLTKAISIIYMLMPVYNSMFHYLAINLDRTLAVARPIWYRATVTKKTCAYICILVWLVSLLITIVRGATFPIVKGDLVAKLQHVTSALIILCGLSYLVCYGIILKIVFRRRVINAGTVQSKEKHKSMWSLSTTEKKTLRVSVGITIAYVILNFPTAISYFFGVSNYQKWLRLCHLLNCSVDSMIYFWLNV